MEQNLVVLLQMNELVRPKQNVVWNLLDDNVWQMKVQSLKGKWEQQMKNVHQ